MLSGPQAAAPPRLAALPDDAEVPAPEPVGTTGPSGVSTIADLVSRRFAIRPGSPNAIFVEYANARWFSAGPPVPYAPDQFVRFGAKGEFPILKLRKGSEQTIYVPVVKGRMDMVAPYTRRER